jgi:hypothetical protein
LNFFLKNVLAIMYTTFQGATMTPLTCVYIKLYLVIIDFCLTPLME